MTRGGTDRRGSCSRCWWAGRWDLSDHGCVVGARPHMVVAFGSHLLIGPLAHPVQYTLTDLCGMHGMRVNTALEYIFIQYVGIYIQSIE